MVFCEPVLASSQALVSFATEKDFIGAEGVLTVQAKEIQKKILGNLIEIKCIVLKDIC
jgi:glycine cleavage system aminomethyltransferase T